MEGDMPVSIIRGENIFTIVIMFRSCMELSEVLYQCCQFLGSRLCAIENLHFLHHRLVCWRVNPVGWRVSVAQLVFLSLWKLQRRRYQPVVSSFLATVVECARSFIVEAPRHTIMVIIDNCPSAKFFSCYKIWGKGDRFHWAESNDVRCRRKSFSFLIAGCNNVAIACMSFHIVFYRACCRLCCYGYVIWQAHYIVGQGRFVEVSVVCTSRWFAPSYGPFFAVGYELYV